MHFIMSIGGTTLPGAAIDPINQMIDSNRGLDALIYGAGGASPEISDVTGCDSVNSASVMGCPTEGGVLLTINGANFFAQGC